MKTGSRVKQGDPTSLSTEGVHPLLDTRQSTLRHESVGSWATLVLPIMKQPNILEEDVSLFSNSAWKWQQGACSQHTMGNLQCKLIPFQKTGLPTV